MSRSVKKKEPPWFQVSSIYVLASPFSLPNKRVLCTATLTHA